MTRAVLTRPEGRVTEVRLFAGDETAWRVGFNVTENFWRTRLKVSLLMVREGGRLPGRDWFRANAPRHFPLARSVTWDELTPGGYRTVTFKLEPASYWQLAAAQLRAFFGVFPR